MDEARAQVSARLRMRRAEIEQAIFLRLRTTAAPAPANAHRTNLLTTVVSSGVEYGLAGIERGDDAGPVPRPLILQARRAARGGAALRGLLDGYFTAYSLFCDFITQATGEVAPRPGLALRDVLSAQAMLLGRVLVAVVDEHGRERRSHPRPPGARQLACVRRLLAGDRGDPAELAYEIEAWHTGAIASGGGAANVLRTTARAADRLLLLVRPDADTVWAWLGGRSRGEVAEHVRHACQKAEASPLVALGEPARGIDGWRLTHRQAAAAMSVRDPTPGGVVRYADVGLLAAVARDPLLSTSLRELYLSPLADTRDGGAGLRSTLLAYFEAGRNVTSAASALGVSRQTVGSRLRTAEAMLGRTLADSTLEIELALRLEALGEQDATPGPVLG